MRQAWWFISFWIRHTYHFLRYWIRRLIGLEAAPVALQLEQVRKSVTVIYEGTEALKRMLGIE